MHSCADLKPFRRRPGAGARVGGMRSKRRHAEGPPSASATKRRAALGGLRGGYDGYCHLVPGAAGFDTAVLEVERARLADLTPEGFFGRYVRARRPLVIDAGGLPGGPMASLFGLRGAAARWAAGGDWGDEKGAAAAMGRGPAGDCEVAVEFRSSTATSFGRQDAGRRRSMRFGDFCEAFASGSELMYLTTQPLPEDEHGCPSALAPPHVLKLLRRSKRLRPQLLGHLAPVQLNMWMGRAADGSTTGLHHDFHDNLYILLRGEKEFRLFSPRCVDHLAPAGAERMRPKLHRNGLITYAPGLREDGAPPDLARSWLRLRGLAERESVDEEDELEAALEAEESRRGRRRGAPGRRGDATDGVPDSFCRTSTLAGDADVAAPVGRALPAALRGRHLSARLRAGDLLYLPASWFHEVVSRGGGAGGHLALNIWMAPPSSQGSFERPYEDDFWEAKYQDLRGAARPKAKRRGGALKARSRRGGEKPRDACGKSRGGKVKHQGRIVRPLFVSWGLLILSPCLCLLAPRC